MKKDRLQKIDDTITLLFKDSRNDFLKITKSVSKRIFRPLQPKDFKNVYLSISKEQGDDLVALIQENKIKNIVEFGTSFGISTLFLAKGAIATDGKIVTTELIESKAQKALENFKIAGVQDYIQIKVGDASETLKDYTDSVDLLLLDGWKDLYFNIFKLLEPNFHKNTIVYVDNADMLETKKFLHTVAQNKNYKLVPKYDGKVYLITIN